MVVVMKMAAVAAKTTVLVVVMVVVIVGIVNKRGAENALRIHVKGCCGRYGKATGVIL